jgi:hypothetical protein
MRFASFKNSIGDQEIEVATDASRCETESFA